MGLETDAKNLGYTEYELILKLLVAKLTFIDIGQFVCLLSQWLFF